MKNLYAFFLLLIGSFPFALNAQLCTDCTADFDLTLDTDNRTAILTNTSSCSGSGTINSVLWDFGDGTTSTESNPSHTYPDAGFYSVCLSTFSDNGAINDFQCKTVPLTGTIFCSANFTHTKDQVKAVFKGSGAISDPQDDIVFVRWDFGDGSDNVFSEDCVEHDFPDSGTYEVCLEVGSDQNACFNQVCQMITVEKVCDAAFDYAVNNTFDVNFMNNSTPDTTIWFHQWDFGDSTYSVDANPRHTYPFIGTYTACLTITTGDDCMDTECQEITINAPIECSTDFSASTIGLSVDFSNLSNSNAPLDFFDWNFGDGNFSTDANPGIHTYAAPGTYEVCLFAGTNLGCGDTKCRNVTVTNTGCRAWFVISPFFNDPLPFSFSDLSYPAGNIQSWLWDFGDGRTSNAQQPTHRYRDGGVYEVCLQITDNNNCIDTNCMELNACLADFEVRFNSATGNIDLINQSKGKITEQFWTLKNFPDTEFLSFDENLSLGDNWRGEWEITLEVEGPEDCRNRVTKTVDFDVLVNTEEISTTFGSVKIFPNPFREEVFVTFPSTVVESEIHYQLVDINGRVQSRGIFENTGLTTPSIRTDQLSKGIYFLHLFAEGQSTVSKLIKMID